MLSIETDNIIEIINVVTLRNKANMYCLFKYGQMRKTYVSMGDRWVS